VLAIQPFEATQVYSLPALQPMSAVNGPSSGLLRVAGEGKLLVYDTSKGPNLFRVDLWSVEKRSALRHISLPAELHKLAVNPAGTMLFTAEGDSLQAWETASGKQRFSITDDGEIRLIVPDPSSAFVATLTDKHLTVWDATNGRRLAEFPGTSAAAFSADGRYLLMKAGDRSASLWLWTSRDMREEACRRLASNMTREEWARWFPGRAYHRTCANLPPVN
jgi:WD40 repeat protein